MLLSRDDGGEIASVACHAQMSFRVDLQNLEPDPTDPHRPTIGQNMVRSVVALLTGIGRRRRSEEGCLPV